MEKLLKLKYTYTPAEKCGEDVTVTLEGFDGWEHVSSLKAAVELMAVENPCKSFARKMKSGEYDNMPEDDIAKEAVIANTLDALWRYPGEEENTSLGTLNIVMLAANALSLIAKHVEYFDELQKDKEKEDK